MKTMLAKSTIKSETTLLLNEVERYFGNDSWELHFLDEHLTYITLSYFEFGTDQYVKISMNKFELLMKWLEEKLGQDNFTVLRSKISNIYLMIEHLTEYIQEDWCK